MFSDKGRTHYSPTDYQNPSPSSSFAQSSPSVGNLKPWTTLSPGCPALPLHFSTLHPNVYAATLHTSPTQHLNCYSLPLWLGIRSTTGNRPTAEYLHLPPTTPVHLQPPLCIAPANSYGRVPAPSHNTSGSRSKAEHLYLPHLSISNPSHNTALSQLLWQGTCSIPQHLWKQDQRVTSPPTTPLHLQLTPLTTLSLPHQEETCCRTSTPRYSSLHLSNSPP